MNAQQMGEAGSECPPNFCCYPEGGGLPVRPKWGLSLGCASNCFLGLINHALLFVALLP